MIKFRMSNGTFRLAQGKSEAKMQDPFLKFSIRTWKRSKIFDTHKDDITSLYYVINR
jgi:hypothetical protein